MSNPLSNRYDFVYLFDVREGNPNGDPDAGNLPRVDPETGIGLVTDVCLKRKIRNFVELNPPKGIGYEIYVKEKAILNNQNKRAYEALDIEPKSTNPPDEVTAWMCKNFYDIRTFGAVMTTGVNCGQVRGPVQLTFGHSIDPIVSLEHSITRMAVTTEKEAEKQHGDNRTMGRKYTVPYGLYRTHGFVSSQLANQRDFSEDDLQLLWDALKNMFEHDRSASRGEMAARKLIVFKHELALGNAPAHKLFDLVTVTNNNGGTPRSFADYTVNIGEAPQGITIEEKF